MYEYRHIHKYISIHMYIYRIIYVYIYTYIFVCIYVCVCMFACTYIGDGRDTEKERGREREGEREIVTVNFMFLNKQQSDTEIQARNLWTQRQRGEVMSCLLWQIALPFAHVLPVATAIGASLASQWGQWWRFLLHSSWKSANCWTFRLQPKTRGQPLELQAARERQNRRPPQQQSSPLCTAAN